MPTLLHDILRGYLRYALFGVGLWAIDRGIASPEQWEALLGGLALLVGTLGWVAWVKVRDRVFFNTALAMDAGTRPDDVARNIHAGRYAPALVPPGEAPELGYHTQS